jgi:hypothetical protein
MLSMGAGGVRVARADASVTPIPTATATITPSSCPTACQKLGYLSVWGPTTVVPSRPAVGDEVTLRYRVGYLLPSAPSCGRYDGSCQMEGGEAYLQGEGGLMPTATPTTSPSPTCTGSCADDCGADACCIENPKCAANEACVHDEGQWHGCCQCAMHTPSDTPTRSPTPTVTPTPVGCVGDCNKDSAVTVDELVRGVNIALGVLPLSQCAALDLDGDDKVSVDELVTAVSAALVGCPNPATPTPTPIPTGSPGATWTAWPGLNLHVSWPAVVEPPQTSFAITITMADDEASYSDWVIGEAAVILAGGSLHRGESASATFDVDWSARPLLSSNRLFYVYARAYNGSTFAQVVDVDFMKPVTEATPTPTLSCGYAGFAVETEPKLAVRYPDSSFKVEIANEGIFQCGDLSWQVVEPAMQPDALSCVPDHGELKGAQPWGETTGEAIQCSIDWSGIPAGQAEKYYLVLFSYPRVNGIDSVHLVEVHLEKPGGAGP